MNALIISKRLKVKNKLRDMAFRNYHTSAKYLNVTHKRGATIRGRVVSIPAM